MAAFPALIMRAMGTKFMSQTGSSGDLQAYPIHASSGSSADRIGGDVWDPMLHYFHSVDLLFSIIVP